MLLAAFLGGGLASRLMGPTPSGPDVAAPSLGELESKLEELRQDVAGLRRALQARDPAIVPTEERSNPPREAVDGASDASIEDKLERLASLIELACQQSRIDPAALSIARLQNPTPNLPEVESVYTRLSQASGDERLTVKRDWLLMSMEQVVRKLGTPSNIVSQPASGRHQTWEYILPGGRVLSVVFTDGVVTTVSG